jgi:hypothetical protein
VFRRCSLHLDSIFSAIMIFCWPSGNKVNTYLSILAYKAHEPNPSLCTMGGYVPKCGAENICRSCSKRRKKASPVIGQSDDTWPGTHCHIVRQFEKTLILLTPMDEVVDSLTRRGIVTCPLNLSSTYQRIDGQQMKTPFLRTYYKLATQFVK